METHDRAAARLAWTRGILNDDSLMLESASADASFRSYWRTHHQGQSWIVMDSPPALEDPQPWLEIGARLSAAGLHVPEVKAHDVAQGFLLIEDLGSTLYLSALNERNVYALYGDAMHALLRMQSSVGGENLPPYDRAFLQRELDIMPEWFLARHLGHAADDDEKAALESTFEILIASALEQPQCFVHRDFHSRNLLVIEPDRSSIGAPALACQDNVASKLLSPGIIDFQGALHGPITYDLASLLRDGYIVWDRGQVEAWAEAYRLRLQVAKLIGDDVNRERFLRWFDLIGLQRHVKVLGIFCRLFYRDGKRGYLDDLPRVYAYVISVARSYPELNGLVSLLERSVGDRDLRLPVRA